MVINFCEMQKLYFEPNTKSSLISNIYLVVIYVVFLAFNKFLFSRR